MKRGLCVLFVLLVSFVFIVGCSQNDVKSAVGDENSKTSESAANNDNANDGANIDAKAGVNKDSKVDESKDNSKTNGVPWKTISLTDVSSNDKFTIESFKGKKVLLETFAVWCPLCTKQQREVKKLHDVVGDEVISISINTDPGEDKEIVLDHIKDNGFDWSYVIAPITFTRSLIDEFGQGIVNAPSVPVVLICEDGSFRKLGRGVKKVDELQKEIAKGC